MNTEKLPVVEIASRWIDMVCFLEYSEKVRKMSYEILYDNLDKKSPPRLMGVIAVYLACQQHGITFNFDKAGKIVYAKSYGKTPKAGLRMHTVLNRAKTWKLLK